MNAITTASRLDARESALTPHGLTCELLQTPLGLDVARPRLSWRLASARRGARQTAYRLQVAATEADLAAGERLLWDSGRRESDESLHVVYEGRPLVSATRYHWAVTVYDDADKQVGRAASWWETGILHRDEWMADWISADPDLAPPVDPPQDDDISDRARRLARPPYLRREFHLVAVPARARVYVTARGLYELRINGERVGDTELAPGWTDYNRRIAYQTYDITGALNEGANVIGGILGEGWWSGYVGFDARRQGRLYGDSPQFLAQLVVDYADGSQQVVVSDASWRVATGALRYADLLMGSYVDARLEPTGWDRPGFDDTGWGHALVVATDHDVLVGTSDQPIRVIKTLRPCSIQSRGGGRHIVDLGQNMVGRVRLHVHQPGEGRRIQIRHAEMLEGSGELYVTNLRSAEATDVYVTRGDPEEVVQPPFTSHGFRYVEVSGYPGDLSADDLVGQVLGNDCPPDGTFRCSDPDVMQLQSNIQWGQRGNFLAVPTDCPQRDERLGWTADAQIFLPTACRNADVAAFFARWMRDVVDAQDDDGAFPDVAPKVCATREGAPAWGDAGVIIPWHLYRVYGDREVLESSFGPMASWVDHILRHNPDLVWRHHVGNHYGDWLQIGVETPREVLATAYFAHSAHLVAQAARVLGRTDDAARYAELYDAIRRVFQESFVDGDGHVTGRTQTAYLLAIAFDLLPEELVQHAVDHLAADVESRDCHLTTGFVGVALLCPVLTDHGRADLAYRLLHQDTFPSWLFSVRQGATTIWERWDGWTPDRGFQSAAMNSFNHYSLGSVGDWLFGRVAGIDQQPDSVAYREVLLRPTVGGRLTWAEAELRTPRGDVACAWRLDGDQLRVDVTVPPSSTAVLRLPTPEPDSVRESGGGLSTATGLRVLGKDADGVALALSSGSFQFTAARPAG